MKKVLLTVNDVMRKLGVNAYGLAKIIGEDDLPVFRMNGELKFNTAQFNDWMREKKR